MFFHRVSSRAAGVVTSSLLLCLLSGCNRNSLNLAPVEGMVTIDGQPLADAGVLFFSTDAKMGQPATGVTDSEGKFTLITANQSGAAIGDHLVAIAKDKTTTIPQSHGLPLYAVQSFIPTKYADAKSSGLSASVKDDDNHFDFSLTSK